MGFLAPGDWASNIGSTPGSSLLAGATGLSAIGDIFGGLAQQGQFNARAQIARNNAIISRQNASYAAQAGEAKTEQLSLRNRGQVAEIAARQAGSGVNPNVGSALDVRKSAGMLGALDVLTARSAAARQAYGYQVQAQGQDIEARMLRKAANLAPIEGGLAAAGSLLGGAYSLQNQYKKWQQEAGGGPSVPDVGVTPSSYWSVGDAGSSANDYEALLG